MGYDVIVAGGGIIGLSSAWKILERFPNCKLLLLEKETGLARHQTGRNSGVLHSGIYYAPGSLKAKLCRQGRQELLEFAAAEKVAHEVCGKVIVATHEAELRRLVDLELRAGQNGLPVSRLDAAGLKSVEPNVRGLAALFVPDTGIIDFAGVCHRLAERIRRHGGEIRIGQGVQRVSGRRGNKSVTTNQSAFVGDFFLNCGGLYSDRLAVLDGLRPEVSIIPFRGEYFTLAPGAAHLVRNLIYPVPDPAFPFLGVHFTRMVLGGVECGPNAVLAFGREAYTRWQGNLRDTWAIFRHPGFRLLAKRYWRMGWGEFRRSFYKPAFVAALQRLVPAVTADMLTPRAAGIRAQALQPDGKLVDDFCFAAGDGSLHVLNAPSPAATAALAIGEHIAQRYAAMANAN